MNGSMIASMIEADIRREKYWKQKKVRQQCYKEGIKQCMECKYQKICEDVEYERNNSIKSDK